MRSLIFSLLFLVLGTAKIFAQKQEAARSREALKAEIFLPPELDMGVRKVLRSGNSYVAAPFSFENKLLYDERYVSQHYLDVMLVQLVSYTPYDDNLKINDEELKKSHITLLFEGKKSYGSPGLLFKFKHQLRNQAFIKWIAIYGNDAQTIVICAVYLEEREHTFISAFMERIVQTASIGNKVIK